MSAAGRMAAAKKKNGRTVAKARAAGTGVLPFSPATAFLFRHG